MTRNLQAEFMIPRRSLIRLGGDGVLPFLNNLLTCDLSGLKPAGVAYGALLSPQGKIQHTVYVHAGLNEVHIDCVENQRDELIRRLKIYRLRAKIDIDADDENGVAATLERHIGWPHDPRREEMGCLLVTARDDLRYDPNYRDMQWTHGLADGEFDIGQNQIFPHEANFDLIGGVSFAKGCYVGQEVVSRMQHRGTARARLLPIVLEQETGTREIKSGDAVIGQITSLIDHRGMALLRLDRLQEATAPLLTGSVRVAVQKPDWMKIDFSIPQVAT